MGTEGGLGARGESRPPVRHYHIIEKDNYLSRMQPSLVANAHVSPRPPRPSAHPPTRPFTHCYVSLVIWLTTIGKVIAWEELHGGCTWVGEWRGAGGGCTLVRCRLDECTLG